MINVGILGAGWAGSVHLNAFSKISNVKITGIFGRPSERTEYAAKKYGCKVYDDFDLMIRENNIDVIDICLPTNLHFEYLIKSRAYGVNILCEKPMALNISEAYKIHDLFKDYDKKIMFAYTLRFLAGYTKIKEFIESGVFGKIKSLYFYRLSEMPPWSAGYCDENLSGGGILDLHIHDLDFVYWLLGFPVNINSIGNKFQNSKNWVQAFTTFNYPGGVHAMIEVNQNMPKSYHFTCGYRVEFEDATLVYNFISQVVKEDNIEPEFFGSLKLYERGSKFVKVIELDNRDPYEEEILYFVDLIRKDNPVGMGNIDDALNGMKIVDEIKKSLEKNLL